ncbi:MAG: hypothetical protein K2G95_05540, partial [Muribaculaceae bacterium]|nr:hypothetical protein [Muribaculaceae bacterium]
ALDSGENVWYYDPAPQLNRFATEGTPFAELDIVSNPRLYVRLAPADITKTTTRLTVKGYEYATEIHASDPTDSFQLRRQPYPLKT